MESMMERNLEYIKLEWSDIHHSRQQEWSALVVIAGIFVAMAGIDPQYDPATALQIKVFLGLLGAFCALVGVSISWQHHKILQQKISVIIELERQIGIQYPTRDVLVPVQVWLFLLFGGICGAFIGMTSGYLTDVSSLPQLRRWAYGLGGVAFLACIGFALYHRIRARKVKSYGFICPFCADMDDLRDCLKLLKDVPLKLVTGGTLNRPATHDRPAISEISWEYPEWQYTFRQRESSGQTKRAQVSALRSVLSIFQKAWRARPRDVRKREPDASDLCEGSITKPVLLNTRDVFQFSLANAATEQGSHCHKHVFEAYVSGSPIDVAYQRQGDERPVERLHVDSGLLIVPPGIPHHVKLSGETFVFQATLAGHGLGGDKQLCSKDLDSILVTRIEQADH